ncbi:selenoneine biosynthesis selenosugar synthase SenB [Marinimicrobium agarilyticum]|uniref:selenoneine biosynthesis selenosugar synthase SenB n=1 Tax=Marinimicrobium agarilyticum TaxID=306546 RepID=UPI000403EA0C|nr:selenoneine biosynthesis selenosugar synthase SenB [Marinimicrobium agarilyticum]
MSHSPLIALITPAAPGSRAGNRATATRWARLLRSRGYRVCLYIPDDVPDGIPTPDLILALHAWRSHDALKAWKRAYPKCPVILALTGTDVYRFQYSHPQAVYDSMDKADLLIGLHDCLSENLPQRYMNRLRVVHQSAEPLPPGAPRPGHRRFEVLVAGHLREEKDSLRAAYAVRDVPSESRLRIVQMGGAHNDKWAQAAREEMAGNPRYRWLGDQPHWRVRQAMSRARLMVISSRMEGGANVVSEACVAGLPVIASDIPGNRGLLGSDYEGYYPVGNTEALRDCLLKAERSPEWLEHLGRQVTARAPLFSPAREAARLAEVVALVMGAGWPPESA